MSATVSIIIPAYNADKYLEECLESVKNQTSDDFEALIIDDGSEDETASIARKYQTRDSRFRLISQPNGGVSRARNVGIEESKGEYLTFLDADDRLHPRAIQSMLESMTRQKADVCIAAFSDVEKVVRNVSKSETYSYPQAMKAALYQKRLLNSPWGMMIKRNVLKAQRFREGIRYEDLDAFYRFYENAARIIYLPYPLYVYRKNPESFLHKWSDTRLDVLDVTDRMLAFFKQNYPELEMAAHDRRFSAHYNMLVLMMKNGVKNPEAQQRCMRVIREGRLRALKDPDVRLKNKIGALASFGGRGFLRILSFLQ